MSILFVYENLQIQHCLTQVLLAIQSQFNITFLRTFRTSQQSISNKYSNNVPVLYYLHQFCTSSRVNDTSLTLTVQSPGTVAAVPAPPCTTWAAGRNPGLLVGHPGRTSHVDHPCPWGRPFPTWDGPTGAA